MHEISFQAVQFLPRFFSVILLLLLTLLVAKFSKSVVERAANQEKKDSFARKLLIMVSGITFWIVILLFSPLIFRAAGLDAVWLRQVHLTLGQFYLNWPIWIVMSLVIAGISYLLMTIQRLIIQLKGTPGFSSKKY